MLSSVRRFIPNMASGVSRAVGFGIANSLNQLPVNLNMTSSCLPTNNTGWLGASILNRDFSSASRGVTLKAHNLSTVDICREVQTLTAKRTCGEAALILGLDPVEFHNNLAAFFLQGNETMKSNYGHSFIKYAQCMEYGISQAMVFSDDQEQTKEELRALYAKGTTFRGGVSIWDFANVTGRASHLYGLEERGFFAYKDVKALVERYNRFGFHGKDEDSTFQLLTRKETRELIRTGQMTPLDALFYAEQLRLDPNADNVLKGVYQQILSSNHKRGAVFGVTC